MTEPNDLTHDWPVDADNAELVRLAEQIQAAPVPLSADAMTRIEQRLRAEQQRQCRWRLVRRLGAAAAVLLTVTGGVYFATRPADVPPVKPPHTIMRWVEDHVPIAVRTTVAVDKPLLRLDDYQSLFADE